MTDPNPTDIFNDFKNGRLDKSSTIDKLFSILQNSKKDHIKIQIIDFFINNLLNEGFDRLKWVISNEKSADCLFEFYESLKRNNNEEARKLKNLLVDNIGEAYIERFKVNREEAFIIGLLDLPEYKVMTSEEGPWPHYITFTVEEGHVVEIYGSEIYPELNLLKAFSNLKRLIIHYSDIDDFKHLGNLKSLENLQLEYVSALNGNGLQDISSLKNLKELHILDTTGMKFIKSLRGLESLTNLEKLSITGGETHESLGQIYENFGEITKIENLENLIKLKELKLYSNIISKIKGLDKLKNLEILDLGDNKIEKINGLRNLISLKELSLGNNQISHITGLDSLINLEFLDLSENKISKITGLNNLKNLKKLYLRNNNLVKIQGLNNLSNLKKLDIKNNNIDKLEGLQNLINLENLFLDGEKLTNVKYSNNMQGTWGVHHPNKFVEFCRRIKNGDFTELDEYPIEVLIDLYKNKKLHKRFWKEIESFIIERGNDDLLLSFYELVVKIFPDRKLVWQLLASNYEKEGNQDKHIVALEHIVSINPNDHNIWSKLILLYKEKNDFHKISDTYKRITVAFPLESKGWFDLAKFYFENTKYKEAFEAINRALNLDSKFKAAIELKTKIKEEFEK